MKIAIIVQDMCGQGAQYATAMTVRMLVQRGWQVDLLVSQVHVDLVQEGVQPFEVPKNVQWIFMPHRRARQNVFFLRRYIKRTHPDKMLIVDMLYNKSVVLATWGMRKSKLPQLSMIGHGNTYPLPEGRWQRWRDLIRHWFWHHKFTSLLVVNQKSAENLRDKCRLIRGVTIANVENACYDEVFLKKILQKPQHPWLKEKACPTFVTAGSYTPNKDHLNLMRAVKHVKESGRKIRVIIFGRGFLEPKYRQYIEENHLSDFVSIGGFTMQLPAEIKASDGFVLSSTDESFGIALAEALACRVPCVSTDAPYGPSGVLAGGRFGRLVPVGDSRALAVALIDLADGKIPVADDDAWRRYTVEKAVERYEEGIGLQSC